MTEFYAGCVRSVSARGKQLSSLKFAVTRGPRSYEAQGIDMHKAQSYCDIRVRGTEVRETTIKAPPDKYLDEVIGTCSLL
jgi:hypothetical protein